jgi:hypothetical protein
LLNHIAKPPSPSIIGRNLGVTPFERLSHLHPRPYDSIAFHQPRTNWKISNRINSDRLRFVCTETVRAVYANRTQKTITTRHGIEFTWRSWGRQIARDVIASQKEA